MRQQELAAGIGQNPEPRCRRRQHEHGGKRQSQQEPAEQSLHPFLRHVFGNDIHKPHKAHRLLHAHGHRRICHAYQNRQPPPSNQGHEHGDPEDNGLPFQKIDDQRERDVRQRALVVTPQSDERHQQPDAAENRAGQIEKQEEKPAEQRGEQRPQRRAQLEIAPLECIQVPCKRHLPKAQEQRADDGQDMVRSARGPRREMERKAKGQPHEAVPAHLGPARTQGLGPFPRHAARHENKAVQRQDKHDCAQYDAEPPGEGPRQFRVHADGEGLLQRIDTFLDIKP